MTLFDYPDNRLLYAVCPISTVVCGGFFIERFLKQLFILNFNKWPKMVVNLSGF